MLRTPVSYNMANLNIILQTLRLIPYQELPNSKKYNNQVVDIQKRLQRVL